MKLTGQPWLVDGRTKRLLAAFGTVPLRFVGGCVRDAIMGRPVGDIDCATPAPPDQVMLLLEEAGLKAVPTGISHGTVTAVVDGTPFEITTLRRDVACDGRHAEIEYTHRWEEDAARRDFTLNALYCDAEGIIYDYTHGLHAAKAGRIVFIGEPDARIGEDALRILRFFRFVATHGKGKPDAAALAACARHAALLDGLSGERIQQEMLKLLSADDPYPALHAMQVSRVWQAILPKGPIVPSDHPHPLLRLALLLPDEAAARALAHRWKLSNADRELLLLLTTHPYAEIPSSESEMLTVSRHLPGDTYRLLLLRNAARHGLNPEETHTLLAQAALLNIPVFPVTGKDLVALGMPSGQELGATLKKLETEWEASGYTLSKDALLALV